MATFSVNQVRHLYVVNAAADLTAGKDLEGNLYLTLKDADGKDVRSDLITNVEYTRATCADDMQRKTTVYKIALASGLSTVVAGQDYIVRIQYRKFISQSDDDSYIEVASARAASTSASDLFKALGKSLVLNTSEQGMVEIKAIVNNAEKAISAIENSDTVTALLVKEIEQPWERGIKASDPVCFKVFADTAKLTSDATVEGEWAAVTVESATYGTTVKNGKKIADLEYFCLGDRASEYRLKGWPYVWFTEYMVDPTKEYDTLDIHYSYVGANHAIQKSEKDITIVCPVGAAGASAHKVMANVIAKINALNVVDIYDPSDLEAEE